MEKKEWYLGLDMGTSSVGWACTNENYELLRLKGKDAWGIREFQEADPAAPRRTNRIARRRRQRETARIGLLKEYFHDAIVKEDPNFYARLDESKYHLEDKNSDVRTKDSIFHDADYTDRDYYQDYKTIFHLRKALIKDEVPDNGRYARLAYLALLNMFKHRGHFLNSGISAEVGFEGLKPAFDDLQAEMEKLEMEDFILKDADSGKILSIFKDSSLSRTGKKEAICDIIGIAQTEKKLQELVKTLCGLETDAKKLLGIETEGKVPIRLDTEDFEESLNGIIGSIGPEYEELLVAMKAFHDAATLAQILGSYSTLSEAMVDSYEKHENDLKRLKKLVAEKCGKADYDRLFRSLEPGSYSAYVNSGNAGGKPARRRAASRKPDDFAKFCKGILKDLDSAEAKEIIEELNNGTFLPKQRTSANGVIPNQIHLMEMKLILKQAEKYLPFLSEKDETGLTVSDKILKIFSFHLPYYIGPTSIKSQSDKGNGWVVRKESGRVFPWNVKEKIDVEKTSEAFIEKLVRKCSYLCDKRVLPKNSLLYERYMILNEINNISIHGTRISPELKQELYENLFLTGKRVTRKRLLDYLRQVKGVSVDDKDLSGIDIDIKTSATSYAAMKRIFGENLEKDEYKALAEEIIYACTVYGDDKARLREVLKRRYQAEKRLLSDDQIKTVMGYKFRDWGRLSREFLEMPGCYRRDGEVKPLIRALYDSSLNMIELINSEEYTYKDSLEEMKVNAEKPLMEMQPEDLEGFYFSAPVKRMIWQTVLVMRELIEAAGCAPKKIFVESTRSEMKDKKRTEDRKSKFLDLYKNIIKEEPEWRKIIESAHENGTLRAKAMYLYLKQQGKDIYTGKRIPLEDLFNKNLYDIDHIYPRSKVTDNSLENNLVLTAKTENSAKSDDLVSRDVQNTQRPFWLALRKAGFMNDEKYKRLTRTDQFSMEEYGGFIARQLVETAQGTKAIKNILSAGLDSDIIFSKAGNVTDFRQQFKIPKVRMLNEFHHAHDAYLNIVVGNVYNTKFTTNPMNFMKEYERDKSKNHYSLYQMFRWDVKRGEQVAWIGCDKEDQNTNHERGTVLTVRKMLEKQTPILSRRSFCQTGQLYNLNIINKDKAKAGVYLPVKTKESRMGDVTKYGGYSDLRASYAFLVEYDWKKGRRRSIEFLPIFEKNNIKSDRNLEEYCSDILEMSNPSVRLSKIKIQSLLQINGYQVYLNGKSNNRLALGNAAQLRNIPTEKIQYLKKISASLEKGYTVDEITKEKNKEILSLIISKLSQKPFAQKPNNIRETVCNNMEHFSNIDAFQQIEVIARLIGYFDQAYIGTIDLSVFGGAKQAGVMMISKVLPQDGDFLLVEKSPAGLYEKHIDLLTV